ncbi:hypothetical protein [Oceanomicrobium pacificus]|uniref:Ferrochelatase n=1 Tax=Oceanomicrobium pacificus TaxID=2692916 RepID=A0A6B0TRT1_9RHOB|nr:hypothetical protein [Oceanomicrobium pacificus]MXU63912.1 hypothetical protein [Oceanomicrobium pacificus]
MMKLKASLAIAAVLAGTAAQAGNMSFEEPIEEVVVVEEPAGSSAGSWGWVIPVLALAAVAYAVTQNNDDDDDDTPASPPPAPPT